MSDAQNEGGVHRLVDMVVEEVSLVDRAANKHRFLIVKRNDAMDDDSTDENDAAEKALSEETDDTTTTDDDSPLGAALAALESLTGIVELLGTLGAESDDTRLGALAEQLRTTAEQILEHTGDASEDDASDEDASSDVEARALTEAPEKAATSDAFASDIASAKQALTRLAELAIKVAPKKPKKPPKSAPSEGAPEVTDSLAKLADSFRALSETVKAQHQRLGRVEKQFGLPNSAAPAEHISKVAPEEVGWPLDLNKPMDRASTHKSTSFHDADL